MNSSIRIVFFGSSAYCIPILQSLQSCATIVAIVTKENSLIHKTALEHHLPVYTPETKLQLQNLTTELRALKATIGIVSDFGMIIPPSVLTTAKHGMLNIHFSRLPNLRGASPVQYTILLGATSAWVSVITMDAGLDTGDILWQKEFPFSHETTGELYSSLFIKTAGELPTIINAFISGNLKIQKQNHTLATSTRILSRSDGFIPEEILRFALEGKKGHMDSFETWPAYQIVSLIQPKHDMSPSILIERSFRAFTPWPGIWTSITIAPTVTKRMKILSLHMDEKTPDKENSRLYIDEVQLEGKMPVSWKQFLQGHPHVQLIQKGS